MISTYTKDFSWKKWPKFDRFPKKKKFPNCQLFMIRVAKNIERFWFFLLSYLVCSQIWLNHLMDDCHFSYITKLEGKKKKNLVTYQGKNQKFVLIVRTTYLKISPSFIYGNLKMRLDITILLFLKIRVVLGKKRSENRPTLVDSSFNNEW